MKDRKDIELEVRRWLDHVVAQGGYNTGVLMTLTNLYYDGANDLRSDLKRLLEITDSRYD